MVKCTLVPIFVFCYHCSDKGHIGMYAKPFCMSGGITFPSGIVCALRSTDVDRFFIDHRSKSYICALEWMVLPVWKPAYSWRFATPFLNNSTSRSHSLFQPFVMVYTNNNNCTISLFKHYYIFSKKPPPPPIFSTVIQNPLKSIPLCLDTT